MVSRSGVFRMCKKGRGLGDKSQWGPWAKSPVRGSVEAGDLLVNEGPNFDVLGEKLVKRQKCCHQKLGSLKGGGEMQAPLLSTSLDPRAHFPSAVLELT